MTQFYQNSDFGIGQLRRRKSADAGAGRALRVIEQRPITGADNGERVNVPAAYVQLTEKGTEQPLGTYLVGAHCSARRRSKSATSNTKSRCVSSAITSRTRCIWTK